MSTKGARPYEGRKMSSARFKLGSGKMSSAHGTNGQSKDNNMNRNAGSTTIGKDCRGFRSGISGEAGYKGGGTAHAKQSK